MNAQWLKDKVREKTEDGDQSWLKHVDWERVVYCRGGVRVIPNFNLELAKETIAKSKGDIEYIRILQEIQNGRLTGGEIRRRLGYGKKSNESRYIYEILKKLREIGVLVLACETKDKEKLHFFSHQGKGEFDKVDPGTRFDQIRAIYLEIMKKLDQLSHNSKKRYDFKYLAPCSILEVIEKTKDYDLLHNLEKFEILLDDLIYVISNAEKGPDEGIDWNEIYERLLRTYSLDSSDLQRMDKYEGGAHIQKKLNGAKVLINGYASKCAENILKNEEDVNKEFLEDLVNLTCLYYLAYEYFSPHLPRLVRNRNYWLELLRGLIEDKFDPHIDEKSYIIDIFYHAIRINQFYCLIPKWREMKNFLD